MKPHLPKKWGFETFKRSHAFWMQRQEDCSLSCVVNTRPALASQQAPVSKNTKVKFKNKRIHGRLRACIVPWRRRSLKNPVLVTFSQLWNVLSLVGLV